MLCVVAGPFVLILLPLIMLFAGHQAEIDIANYKLAKRRAEEERKIKEREREIKEREREREREIIIEKQQFQKDMLIFKNEVEAMVNVLYEDKQAKKLIHNFFNKFPQDILLTQLSHTENQL